MKDLFIPFKESQEMKELGFDESFYSLMDSLELDRSKNYLLIEKL